MSLKKIDYLSSRYFSCDITPKRIAKRYELEIHHGGMGASYIDGKSYLHSESKVIFAKPGQERFSIGEFHCYAIQFTCDDPEINGALQKVPDCFTVDPVIKAKLIKHYERFDPEDRISAYTSIFNILNILTWNQAAADEYMEPSAEVAFVKEYIDEHFTQNIDIKELADKLYLSPNYLRKKFSTAYGTTIQKYIIDMRLGMVKKLLLTTNKTLSDIAYCSGFNSQSHMNVMFRSAFGLTPLEFKKQHYIINR